MASNAGGFICVKFEIPRVGVFFILIFAEKEQD